MCILWHVYCSSHTYVYDGTEVDVPYTQGSWKGKLAHDRVTIPSLPSVNVTADIAFLSASHRFFQNDSHWQGILGLAYPEIVRVGQIFVKIPSLVFKFILFLERNLKRITEFSLPQILNGD